MNHKLFSTFKNKTWIWILLILTVAVGIRVYRVSQKENLFLDEGLTVVLSEYNNYGWDKNFNEGTVYTGKELRELMLFDNNSLNKTVSDIVHLRQDNRDSPHTNLYYSIFRLWFSGVKTANLHRIIVQGFCLNLLFFLLSFFLLYKLAKKLFSSNWLILLTLVLAYLNPAAITNTLYLREYQMQEMLFVWMTYVFVNYYYLIKNNEKIDSWQSMLKLSILVSFVLLSGYFALFYVAMLGLILIIISYQNNQKQNFRFLIVTFLVAFAFAGTLYCKYYDGFLGYRGTEALGKLENGGILKNIIESAKKYIIDMRGYLFSVPAILVLVLLAVKVIFVDRKRGLNIDKIPLFLSICGLLWSMMIMFFVPFKSVYYFMSIIPIMILIIPFLIGYLKRIEMMIVVFIFATIFTVKAISRKEVYMGNFPVEKAYLDNSKLPVIVCLTDASLNAALLSHFTDDRKFEFPHSNMSFDKDLIKYDNVIVIISEENRKNFPIPEDYSIKQQYKCNWFFDGYVLEKKNSLAKIN